MNIYDLDFIRGQIIGNNLLFNTPYGQRHLLYADYTASGRGLRFIEEKILNIEKAYANTHTEDDFTGKYLTTLLHQAEERIKRLVNAGPNGKIIATGSGATGALKKLQEIIGVYIPPVSLERIQGASSCLCGEQNPEPDKNSIQRPVAFIGPYEHHTNELMWREAFVDVEVIPFNSSGSIDLEALRRRLAAPEYRTRQKIGSFSAGSNITGIRTPVYEIAKICHQHGALVFFDFAAVAPYIEIDMNRDEESYFDAVFFSPHKFLGGPGTSGILVFNQNIYRRDLPPTTAGGGTVVYVGVDAHDFSEDIETREKAGTPPILQTIKAALVLDLKSRIGTEAIARIEARYTRFFVEEMKKIENIELIGETSPENRVSIVSFNIQHRDRILHPKFATKLMNDLFGIQSRAGCSCAGPYGHILLNISDEVSSRFRSLILQGCSGLKPGWVRVNIHYTLTDEDVGYLLQAIRFIARSGHLFLQQYRFNIKTAEWTHRTFKEEYPNFSVDENFSFEEVSLEAVPDLRKGYLEEAKKTADSLALDPDPEFALDEPEIESMKTFYYLHREKKNR